MATTIKGSVRALCEFLLRAGSIDSRFSGLDRAGEGGRIHRMLQKKEGPGYRPEVTLRIEIEQGDFLYQLQGRADGVFERDGLTVVDEIKSTVEPLDRITADTYPAHWAQGACYAHILCTQQGLSACGVRLTYCNAETGEVQRFERRYTAGELEDFLLDLLGQYERWARLQTGWKQQRDACLQRLAFPFEDYREGQRKMAVACYRTFEEGGRLFCCAPTGVGKTMSALFPAMKALGEGHGERIFYLTAKTITRQAAQDALARLDAREPLDFYSLTLTAKDKLCFLEERACFPESCPYADGYYDRVNDAVYEILQKGRSFGREDIEAAARQYRLCPYELSLDLALWCDCVICDYNYLFDPVVKLQRFFEGRGGEYLFLVDEAHNLVDRSREMYSATLRKRDFFEFKKQLPKSHRRLHKALNTLNSAFVALRKECEAAGTSVLRQAEFPVSFAGAVEGFSSATELFLEDNRGSEWEQALLALYFEALFFARIAEEYGDNYTTLIYRSGGDVTLKLLCLDPSGFLDACMSLGRASVLFSATLQPLPYYRRTLGGGESARLLELGSPFNPAGLGLFVASGVSTKYADRERSLPDVARLLAQMAEAKRGNYIAYFPSYSYMRRALEEFEARYPHIPTLQQTGGMDEAAREDFLASFAAQGEETLLGFCVLGGIFAEGVDLPGDRLIGCAVVGVGLPQIGPEPDAIRDYYDEAGGQGFAFAYQFPGMNKVLQAAGRVIRTETDRGVVLLIDSRFDTPRYRELFPAHWRGWQRVSGASLPAMLRDFWEREDLEGSALKHPQGDASP